MPTIADLSVHIGVEGNLDQGLKQAAKSVGDLGSQVNKAAGQYDGSANKMAAANSKIGVSAKNAGKTVAGSFSGVSRSLDGVSDAIAGAFTVGALLSFGSAVINTTAEFQRMEAVLTNTLGSSSAAQNAMFAIQDLAAKTPFSVGELTDAYIKLANRGIQPTTDQLTKMGDVAAALGKPLSDVNEALLDVSNTERWNELGIKVSANGDKMTGTFKGLKVEVERTEAGALKMIETFGQMPGVAGQMGSSAATLGGKLSNLKDNFTTLFAAVGNGVNGPLTWFIDKSAKAASKLSDALTSNDKLAQRSAAPELTNFGKIAEAELKKVSEAAQKAGQDVNQVLASKVGGMSDRIKKNIADTQKEIDALGSRNASLNVFDAGQRPEIERNQAQAQILRERRELYKGEIQVLEDLYAKISKGPPPPPIVNLESLRKELSALTDQYGKLDVSDKAGLASKKREIESLDALIKKYEGLGSAKTKAAIVKVPPAPEIEGPRIAEEIKKNLKPVDSFSLSELFGSEPIGKLGADVAPIIPPGLDELPAKLEKAKNAWQLFQEDVIGNAGTIQQVIADGLGGAFDALGTAIGNTFAGQDNIFANIEKQMRDFAKSFGQFLIKYGLGQILINPIIGGAAIVAGGALMAFGGGGGKGAGAGAPRGGGSYSAPTNRANTAAFAGAGENGGSSVEFKIRGTELVGVLRQQGYKDGR